MLPPRMIFQAYDHLDDAIIVCDAWGSVTYANPSAYGLYGDGIVGAPLQEAVGFVSPALDLKLVKQTAFRSICLHRGVDSRERQVNWSLKWIDDEPGHYLSISAPTTGGLGGSDDLRLRAFVDAMPNVALFVDRDHKIILANQALANELNATVEELEGELATKRFPKPLADVRAAHFEQAKSERRTIRFEDERGGKHYISTVSPAFDTEGKVSGAAIFSVDVTELKLSHGRRLELEERLSQTERLESIGRLAGGIAHDFNNLLMGILGFAELSLTELAPEHPVYSNLMNIREAGEHAADLTRRLLTFSRRQVVEPQVLDLNVVVHDTQALLGRVIGEDVELRFLPMDHEAMVRVDPTQVNQILMNLATNARDAMQEGGRLTIELSEVVVDEEFCRLHPGLTTGRHVQLAVSDSGVGMTEEAIEKAFEPFFTTKPRDRGTGLGLSTVHGIVNQSGGVVAIYSELNVGTTFKIYLPITDDAPAVLPSRAPPALPQAPSGITVLLVEDEPLVREVAHSILARAGFHVIEAADGRSALELMNLHENVSVLLTDVIMPDMNGKELFDRLRLQKPDLECVFMSGYTDHVIVPHGVLKPGVAFLEKPFSARTLITKIQDVLSAAGSGEPASSPPHSSS